MTSKEYHEGYQQGFKDAKADYENRLKADMVAMLEDLLMEIFKESWRLECICDDLDGSAVDWDDIRKVIQQKINSLKEAKDENEH